MKNKKKSLNQKNKGQGLIEYLILVAIIAIGTLGIMRILGQNISAQFASITHAIQGNKKKVKKSNVQETHIKIKDLGNFLNGAASSDEKK